MQTISFQGIFKYTSYLRFLRDVGVGSSPRELLVDFGDVRFFHPDGMAPLVATIRHLQDDCAWNISAAYPKDPMLQDYFDKAGWSSGIRDEPPLDPPVCASYVPLSSYANATELNSLIVRVMDCLRRTAVYGEGVLDAVEWSLNEIADNVLLHAGDGTRGWIQVAARPKERQVEIVVADCGRGITASLREGFPDLSGDAEALRRAIQKGITRDRRVGLGNGLNGTMRIAEAARGWANFHSGTASLRLRNDGRQSLQASAPGHKGLLATVTLPTKARIDVTAALWGNAPVSSYESTNATDTGVRFRVADHASSMGNRASARPLRNAVENLLRQFPDDYVLIDFEGIQLVASSFADEFVGRLADQLGRSGFEARIRLVNASGFIRRTTDSVVRQRLGPPPAGDTGLLPRGR